MSEPYIQAGLEILGTLNHPAAQIGGALVSGVLSAWQVKNLNQFKTQVKYEIGQINMRKIDRSFIQSDQFAEFIFRLMKDASETSSQDKHRALSRLLKCAMQGNFDDFQDKNLLRRLIDQISDMEMQILSTISQIQESWKLPNQPNLQVSCIEEVSKKLSLKKEDSLLAVEGLQQLQLVRMIDGINLAENESPTWTTEIAKRLILSCLSSPYTTIN